jgi:hypothetical protein
VLIALAVHANKETGEAWPSVATLERETGLKERAVQMALRELQEAGEISLAPGSGRGGRGKPSRYTLRPLLAKGAGDAGFGASERVHETTKRVHGTTQNPAPDAPEVVRKRKEPRAGDAAYGASPNAEAPCKACGDLTLRTGLEAGFCPTCWQAFEERDGWEVGAS